MLLQRLVGRLEGLLLLLHLLVDGGQPVRHAPVVQKTQAEHQRQQGAGHAGGLPHGALAALGHVALYELALADHMRGDGFRAVDGRQVAVERRRHALVRRRGAEVEAVGARVIAQGVYDLQVEELVRVALFLKDVPAVDGQVYRARAQRLEHALAAGLVEAGEPGCGNHGLHLWLQRHALDQANAVGRQIGQAVHRQRPPLAGDDGVVTLVIRQGEQAQPGAIGLVAQRHEDIGAPVLHLLQFVGQAQVLAGQQVVAQAQLPGDEAPHIDADAAVALAGRVVARHRRRIHRQHAQRRQRPELGLLLRADRYRLAQADMPRTRAVQGRRGQGTAQRQPWRLPPQPL